MRKLVPIAAAVVLSAGCGLLHHDASAKAGGSPSVVMSPSASPVTASQPKSLAVNAATCWQIETYPKIHTVAGLRAFVTFLRQRVTRPGLAPSLSAQVRRLLDDMIADTGSPLTAPLDIEAQRGELSAACSPYAVASGASRGPS